VRVAFELVLLQMLKESKSVIGEMVFQFAVVAELHQEAA
jgi:hypothetical protein